VVLEGESQSNENQISTPKDWAKSGMEKNRRVSKSSVQQVPPSERQTPGRKEKHQWLRKKEHSNLERGQRTRAWIKKQKNPREELRLDALGSGGFTLSKIDMSIAKLKRIGYWRETRQL